MSNLDNKRVLCICKSRGNKIYKYLLKNHKELNYTECNLVTCHPRQCTSIMGGMMVDKSMSGGVWFLIDIENFIKESDFVITYGEDDNFSEIRLLVEMYNKEHFYISEEDKPEEILK